MKKVLSLLMAVVMLLSITSGLDLTAYAETVSGKCGNNAYWSLDKSTKKLTITGSGKMTSTPWRDYLEYICYVDISGVSNVCSYAFVDNYPDPDNIESVTIGEGVKTIEYKAFCSNDKLKRVDITGSVEVIKSEAFDRLWYLNTLCLPDSLKTIEEGAFAEAGKLSYMVARGIFYDGTPEQWSKISINTTNNEFLSNVIVHYQMKDHDWVTKKYEPDCTNRGYTDIYCSVCDYGGSYDYVDELGHDFVVTSPKKEPTCTKTGIEEKRTCTRCGETEGGEEIAATGHRIVKDKKINAACTQDGKTEGSHCTVCKEVLTPQEIIPATGHAYFYGFCLECDSADPNYLTESNNTGNTNNGDNSYYDDYYYYENNSASKAAQSQTASIKKPKKEAVKKLFKGKKSFKVYWKKLSGVTGYQIQYSTDKKFKKNEKTVTVKGSKNASKTIKKLKGGKKYYVRVRAYNKVKIHGVKYSAYGSWSKTKTVVTKK